MKHEIFGIAYNHEVGNYKDLKCIRDDGGERWYETPVHQHREEGLDFDYTYILKAMDMNYLTGEKSEVGHWVLELVLVPTPDSLTDEARQSVASTCGIDPADITSDDISSDGLCVQMETDSIHGVTDDDAGIKMVDDRLNEAVAVIDIIDHMRGFNLDRCWNRIGSNGWDIINNYCKCGNGKSFITAGFERLKKMTETVTQ